jgi:glutathione transport system ATP-binding protein
MAVVERVSHQVGVMYLGRIVEIGPRAAVFETPQHPYTKALMKVVPIADLLRRKKKPEFQTYTIAYPSSRLCDRAICILASRTGLLCFGL